MGNEFRQWWKAKQSQRQEQKRCESRMLHKRQEWSAAENSGSPLIRSKLLRAPRCCGFESHSPKSLLNMFRSRLPTRVYASQLLDGQRTSTSTLNTLMSFGATGTQRMQSLRLAC